MEEKLIQIQTFIFQNFSFLKSNKLTAKLIEALLTPSFFKYLITGFSTFFMQIGLLFLISQIFNIEKQYANIFSTLLSMIFNYTISNNWSFKAGSGKHKQKLSKYLFLAAVNYIFDVVIAFPFLAVNLGINPYLCKVIITGCIICWNFFLYKFWVFKK